MHINVIVRHLPGEHDLGYWEGEPPAVGDLIAVAGRTCRVEERYWIDHLSVMLLAEPTRTRWMHGNKRRDT